VRAIDRLNDEGFSLLLKELSSDIGHAHFHYKLLRALLDVYNNPSSETFSQSRTFWFLTIEAHQDATLFRLGRVFDQGKDGLSLGKLLQTIKAYPHFFDEAHFRKRFKNKVFAENLTKDFKKLSMEGLERDIGLVSVDQNQGGDDVVRRFVAIRKKYLAHKDPKPLLSPAEFKTVADLSWADVEHLLDLANSLIRKYSLLFSASVDSTSMLGQDDYKYVIEAIEDKMQAHKASMETMIKYVDNLDTNRKKE
jgi:hypothetical protein